jgi:hypothetical protein
MSKQPFFLDHEHHPPFAFFPGISEFRVPGLSSSRAPCQCPPPRSTAGVPPPCLPTGEITTLAPQGRRGRSQSPPWFRLAPSWAYRFLSDRPSPILADRDASQGSAWTGRSAAVAGDLGVGGLAMGRFGVASGVAL